METSKRHLPFSGYEEPREFKRMAVGSDEKIHISATSQSDDLRKISLKMLTMETRLQNPMPDSMHANNCLNPTGSASLDSTDRTGNANGGDWQEEVHQKIKAMKELYLHDLNDMYHKVVGKLQQYDSIPQQPKNEYLEKLKVFKNMLERFMAFLQIPKQSILASYKDKLGTYEKQIVNVINSNRRKPEAPQQHDNQMSSQMQTRGSMGGMQQNSVSLLEGSSNTQRNMMKCASLDSTYQTRSENGGDWQQEVYQEIKAMKGLYLHDLNAMHQKILVKMAQYDSLPQQPNNEYLEKLKVFKNMLERFMAFLQIPKQNILASYKDKLGTYEKQIVNVINSNRRKP